MPNVFHIYEYLWTIIIILLSFIHIAYKHYTVYTLDIFTHPRSFSISKIETKWLNNGCLFDNGYFFASRFYYIFKLNK